MMKCIAPKTERVMFLLDTSLREYVSVYEEEEISSSNFHES
jgi:hypothetical protein